MSQSIEKEPEDIFAQDEEEEEDDDESLSGDEQEDMRHDNDSERKAAAALTSLVTGEPEGTTGKAADNKEFKIPLRFTKSGRKRAVPFPMKVGLAKLGFDLAPSRGALLTPVSFRFILSAHEGLDRGEE